MDKYLASAKKGAEAQFQIGLLYNGGKEVKTDYKKAMEWFLKAANQGHAYAQHYIGVMYQMGEGVPQDYKKAMEYFLKAAGQVEVANFHMGILFEFGYGVPQDYFKALELYHKSLDGGLQVAQNPIDDLTKNINAQKTKWTVSDVISWMSLLKLSESYKELIQANHIDGQVLVTMTTNDWREIGVKAFGDIRKLEIAISALVGSTKK